MENNLNELDSFFDGGFYNIDEDILPEGPSTVLKPSESKILILASCVTNELPEAELDLLRKILNAVGVDIDTTTFLVNPLIESKQIIDSANYDKCLSFGINQEPLSLFVDVNIYTSYKYNDITFLFSDSLQTLIIDADKKKFLWNALQLIFKK